MQELIRNTLITITTILAALGIYIKTIDGLIINIIKLKYKNVPGKKSKFNVVIELIGYIILSIYLVAIYIIVCKIFNLIKIGGFNEIKKIFETSETSGSSIIVTIFCLCFMGVFGCMTLLFIYVPPLVSEKIKGQNIHENKLFIKIINYIGIIMLLIAIGINMKGLEESIRNSIDSIDIVKNNGLYIFENNISDENMSYLVFWIVIIFINITNCIILNSFRDLYNGIFSENMYTLITNSKCIFTRYYLEYDEYYLMYENNIECYIKKSDIKEIKKMKILYNESEIGKYTSENNKKNTKKI